LDTVSISDNCAGSGSGAAALTERPGGAESDRVQPLDEDRLAWLALTLTPGLGPRRILDAVKQLKSASQIFTMALTALEGLRFPAEAAQFLFDGKGRKAAEEEWARVAAQGAVIIDYASPEYPERLREIYDPPTAL
jgi:DNA processing protein